MCMLTTAVRVITCSLLVAALSHRLRAADSTPPAEKEPSEADATSPLAAAHSAWERWCAADFKQAAVQLSEFDRQLQALVPQDQASPSTEAVTKAWSVRQDVLAAWDTLLSGLRRYNEIAWQWRPVEGTSDPTVNEGGVIDSLCLTTLPDVFLRWESLRPLVLPLRPADQGPSIAPWEERPRVKQRLASSSKAPAHSTLGWDDPDGDAPEWKLKAGRWAYDFALLHRWVATPPEDLKPRLRTEWLAAEAGVEFGRTWASMPFTNRVVLFRGQYEWRVAPPPPTSTNQATRPAAVIRLLAPPPAPKSTGTLAALEAKHALLETLVWSVVYSAGGVTNAPLAAAWVEVGAHANPPWTLLRPALGTNGQVRAMMARQAYTQLPQLEAPTFQFAAQIDEFRPDGSWVPAAQSWSGWIPFPAELSTAPTDSQSPSRPEDPQPGDLDRVWPGVCEWAAGEAAGRLSGRSVVVLPPSTPGWWFAFPVETLVASLKKHQIAFAADGVPIQCEFYGIEEGHGAQVALLLDRAKVANRTVSIPGPWLPTFATRGWLLWPWLTGAMVLAGIFLLRWKLRPRFGVESWGYFLVTEPLGAAVFVSVLGLGGALTLSLLGPRIEQRPVSFSGSVRIVLPAHRGVPEGQRMVAKSAATSTFRKFTGSTGVGTLFERFWRAIRTGLYLEPVSRPAVAAQDAMWQLCPAADGGSQTLQQGLLRAQNEGEFLTALREWKFDGIGPSELLGPGAGASVTLVCTDGDHGMIHPEQPHPSADGPVVTLLMLDPSRDPRAEVAVGPEACALRLATNSTVLLSAVRTSFPRATPLASALRSSDEAVPSEVPEDMQERRNAFWNSVDASKAEALGGETALRLIQETSQSQAEQAAPPRLANRLVSVWGFLLLGLATVALGIVGARTIYLARDFLNRLFQPGARGDVRRRWIVMTAVVLLFVQLILSAALAAWLEPLSWPLGWSVLGLVRLAPQALLLLLLSSFMIAHATRGSDPLGRMLVQPLNKPRLLAALSGVLILGGVISWAAIMPNCVPSRSLGVGLSFSGTLVILSTAWVLGVGLCAFAATAVPSKRSRPHR